MVWIARSLVVAAGIAGGVATSQAPEFTQQYRQRLGGALEELRAVVADFDADARRNDLSRQEALTRYRASADAFLRERGVSVNRTIDRFETLDRQSRRFAAWPEAARPLVLVGESDVELIGGAWSDFRPGVPVTVAGLIWAAAGFVLFALLAHGTRVAGRGLAGTGRRRGVEATRQGKAAYAGAPAMDGPVPEVMPDPDGPVVSDGRNVRH